MALAGLPSLGISSSSSSALSGTRGDSTGAEEIGQCLQMLGEPTASTMVGKLQNLPQTAAANPAQAQADVAELAQCLQMMPNGADLVAKLQALAGPSVETVQAGPMDSFSSAPDKASPTSAPLATALPSASPESLWSSDSKSAAPESLSSILKTANDSPLS